MASISSKKMRLGEANLALLKVDLKISSPSPTYILCSSAALGIKSKKFKRFPTDIEKNRKKMAMKLQKKREKFFRRISFHLI